MALTGDQVTAQNFADFYNTIKPYLNGGGMGMKLLWENSDPTQNVASGDQASLSSDDYDLALYIAKRSTSDQRDAAVVICAKGDNGLLSFGMSTIIYSRTFNVSGTTVTFGAGTAGNSTENSICIPYRIYGIKVYHRPGDTDIKAQDVIYGSGTVKDALDEERNHSIGTYVSLTLDTEYITPSDGYFRVTCNDSGNYYSTGYVDNKTMITAKSSSSDAVSGCAAVFVRKGTSIKFKGTNATVAGGTFFPLV